MHHASNCRFYDVAFHSNPRTLETSKPFLIMPIFVIQKHHAKNLHYDFRLEKDGVLKSWAVPKGVSDVKGVKRLAVATDDHEMRYADFEGIIEPGEYGAGKVEIWDRGTYEEETWDEDRIVFKLNGTKLKGRFSLVSFKKAGEKTWLIFFI